MKTHSCRFLCSCVCLALSLTCCRQPSRVALVPSAGSSYLVTQRASGFHGRAVQMRPSMWETTSVLSHDPSAPDRWRRLQSGRGRAARTRQTSLRLCALRSGQDESGGDGGGDGEEPAPNGPADIPNSSNHWLVAKARLVEQHHVGVGKRKPLFCSYATARAWARCQWFESQQEWEDWIVNHVENLGVRWVSWIPKRPQEYFRDKGWVSWEDFLGPTIDPASESSFHNSSIESAFSRHIALHKDSLSALSAHFNQSKNTH